MQPVFSFQEVICNIEELSLSSENVTTICNVDCGGVNFRAVSTLHLRCFHNESDAVPWAFLQRFTNLKNLLLECSSFVQIFCGEVNVITLRLKSLALVNLRKLENLCLEISQIQPIFQNLEELLVIGCDCLKNIVPSWMLLQNLNTLVVYRCSRLINITRLSTTSSFMKLKELLIYGCEMMEEIVACEKGDAVEVAFMKLEVLRLVKLPRLTSFSKGNYSFKFPLLKKMFVAECPMMKTFSHASLSTPNLEEVLVTMKGDEWCWEGDLNATIKQLSNDTSSSD